MNRHLLDARVWGPTLVGVLCFVPRALPTPLPAAPPRAAAIELPAARGLPPGTGTQQFELATEQSAARFLVRGPGGELLATCPGCSGSLQLDAQRGTGSLELRLDLVSLVDEEPDRGLDLHHVLGALRTTELVYRGELAALTRTSQLGVQCLSFDGLLHVGDRAIRQPMQLWQCQLPGQALRLQGNGTVDAATFGLPERRWLGLWPERHEVTLGLDLAWRRRRAN